ncbi:hypothetical protein D3C71_2174030 [compost metagenome]
MRCHHGIADILAVANAGHADYRVALACHRVAVATVGTSLFTADIVFHGSVETIDRHLAVS